MKWFWLEWWKRHGFYGMGNSVCYETSIESRRSGFPVESCPKKIRFCENEQKRITKL